MQSLLTSFITSNPPSSFFWIIRAQTGCFRAVSRSCTAALRTAAGREPNRWPLTPTVTQRKAFDICSFTLIWTEALVEAQIECLKSDISLDCTFQPLHRNNSLWTISFLFHVCSVCQCKCVLYFTLTGYVFFLTSSCISFAHWTLILETVNKVLILWWGIRQLKCCCQWKHPVFRLFKPLYDYNNAWKL